MFIQQGLPDKVDRQFSWQIPNHESPQFASYLLLSFLRLNQRLVGFDVDLTKAVFELTDATRCFCPPDN